MSEQSNVSAEQEVDHRQGWLDSDLKNSNNFLDDDDVDDLGKSQTQDIPPSIVVSQVLIHSMKHRRV